MDYNKQAEDFLFSCNVSFEALKAIPQLAPNWSKDGKHGTHYSITLSKYAEPFKRTDWKEKGFIIKQGRPTKEIQFNFWNSLHAKEQSEHGKSDKPRAYDVLAGIYTQIESFEDFCSNFDYDEDSRTAERTFKEVQELNAKLETIFNEEELAKLQEIN